MCEIVSWWFFITQKGMKKQGGKMIFRVLKTRNYTIMSNTHLKDKRLSLKAKGLLSVMLSLPDEWDYSIDGLAAISKENETAVKSTLKELKDNGYLEVIKLMPNQTESGRIEYVYNVYENPKQESEKQGVEKLGVENLGVEIQPVENRTQLITKELNTKELITKDSKAPRHKYGEYQHVLLTTEQYEKLSQELGDKTFEYIRRLDEYIEMKGAKYKNHYLTIKNWHRRDSGNNFDNARKHGIEIDEDFREGMHDVVFGQY